MLCGPTCFSHYPNILNADHVLTLSVAATQFFHRKIASLQQKRVLSLPNLKQLFMILSDSLKMIKVNAEINITL